MNVLLVAEGSGGHLIPALEVAETLAQHGARIKVWYAQRRQAAPLTDALLRPHPSIDVDAIPVEASPNLVERLWRCGQLWRRAQRCFDTFAPDVVVGFGGWVSAPVVLAACLRQGFGRQAKNRRIGCLLHEQNVVLGRANRWLAPWVDRIAVSFRETQVRPHRAPSVMTGLPIRQGIGRTARAQAAARFGLDPERPTLAILGGSQGSRAINRVMLEAAARFSPAERERWQLLHVTGSAEAHTVRAAYRAQGVTAWVAPFLVEMDAAYALADVVIGRAGASTIAELARCGTPAVLIPYPYAGNHQRANAAVVEAIGGGVLIDESAATPARVLGAIRRLLGDRRLRLMMGRQMRELGCADAADRLRDVIVEVAQQGGQAGASS